jgi:hypothetical protein
MSNENSTAALNVGAAPTGPAREGVIVYLQKVATIGTLAKTLLGFGIAIGAAGVSVYHHFAKTYELRALQCSVIDQNKVNNEVFHAAGEVRSALVLLKTNLDDAGGSPATAKRVAEEMSKSLGNINEALKRIEQMRDNLLVDVSVRGERKC